MTPEEEKKLQDWYTLEFRDLVEQSRTLGPESLQEGRPEDWKRLQIWDGQNLVPAMPDGIPRITPAGAAGAPPESREGGKTVPVPFGR